MVNAGHYWGYMVNVLFCFDSIHTGGHGREAETGGQRQAEENGQTYVHTIYGLKIWQVFI